MDEQVKKTTKKTVKKSTNKAETPLTKVQVQKMIDEAIEKKHESQLAKLNNIAATAEEIKPISPPDILVKKLDKNATLPTRAHDTDAGLDLYALEEFTISPIERVKVKTGLAIRVPAGYVGIIKEKSGLSLEGIEVKAGVIDEGYSDEVGVVLSMADGYEQDGKDRKSNQPKTFKAGQKIAQLVVVPVNLGNVVEVDELPESQRGKGGWGSTGE